MASRISAGGRSRRRIDVRIVVEGDDRTSATFKQARSRANAAIRQVMVDVGERHVLPDMRRGLPSWAALFVQRERSGVFIGSKLRGSMNRALGWFDFGGKRPFDTAKRTGPKVLVRTLDHKRDDIDTAVLRGLGRLFEPFDHTP